MNSRPRHARKNESRRTAQILLRAGLMATAAGAVVGATGGSAAAAGVVPNNLHTPVTSANSNVLDKQAGAPTGAATGALTSSAGQVTRPVKTLRPNPMAGTPVNPLSNSVGTQVDDFKPVSSAMATGPLAKGSTVGQLPVTGQASNMLP